ncbi:MAG: P27 family phage terminase small subunit [Gammaproteobacteria bacterium]|nr:P27 family phage terminase small subunit [Gammaproteobacteria bacterium]
MTKKADPNKGNVSQFPGDYAGHSDDWHIQQAADMRPAGLKAEECDVWDVIAPELSKVGRLKKLYIEVICEYCRIVAKLAEAREYLDREEWTYVTTGRHGSQEKSRPEVAQLNDDWRKFRSLVSELGLSPAAEKSLNSKQGDLFGPNPYSDL